jgi:hypothetical protein
MKGLKIVWVALALGACGGSASAQQPDLVGTWEWSRKKDGCVEQYVFRPDGTVSIRRGEQVTQNSYRMSWAPEPGGRYRLAIVNVGDDGGRDCDGAQAEGRGRQSESYALFGQSRETMILCGSPTGADCTGLMRRTAR